MPSSKLLAVDRLLHLVLLLQNGLRARRSVSYLRELLLACNSWFVYLEVLFFLSIHV